MPRRGVVATAVAVLLLAAGCTAAEPPADPAAATASATATSAPDGTPSTSSPDGTASGAHRAVEFPAADGEPVAGRFFDGPAEAPGARDAATVGVVLSHMGRSADGPDDWQAYAESLADRGYLVLTYTARPQSSDIWQDVLGGVRYLREAGATTVVAAGASLGAMAGLYAATERPRSGIDAVLWLAGVLDTTEYSFDERDVARLDCPMLIVSGDADSYGAAADARELHRWTADVSELVVLPTRYHGTDILSLERPRIANDLRRAMNDFVDRVAADRPRGCTAG